MRAFLWGRKMPLPSVEQFIGTNVTEQGFKDAQKQLVEYVGNEVPKKIDTDAAFATKADKATTLAGYGIADTYTKSQVDASITAVSGGHKAYQTLASAQAAQASLPVNTIVEVTNDSTASNNGSYQWNGTTLTKSAYDPLTQAKADATTKANTAEANAKTYTDTKTGAAEINAKNYADQEIAKIVEDAPLASAVAITDAEGFVLAEINTGGEVLASDFSIESGSLSETIKKTSVISTENTKALASAVTDDSGTILHGVQNDGFIISPYPPVQGLGIEAIRSQLLSKDKLKAAGRYLDKLASNDLEPMNWEVMVAPDSIDGLGINRMGTMIQVSENRFYVVFSQFSGSGTDQTGARIVGRFVDVDFVNQTSIVSETRVIYDAIGTLESAPRHPNLVEVKDGILLIFNRDKDFTVYKSTDWCQTWVEVYSYVPVPRFMWLAPDCVVKIPDGLFKGRIVACCFDPNEATDFWRIRSMYSDDDGLSWHHGYDVDPYVDFGSYRELNESGVATDTDNNIIMAIRNGEGSATNLTTGKVWFKSTDGGKSIKLYNVDEPFITGSCQNGIIQFAPHVRDGIPKIITVSTLPTSARVGLRLRISYDNAKNWAWTYEVFNAGVTTGYSSIKRVNSNMIGVVYEYGGFNVKSNIAIRFLNFKEIFNVATI